MQGTSPCRSPHHRLQVEDLRLEREESALLERLPELALRPEGAALGGVLGVVGVQSLEERRRTQLVGKIIKRNV